MTIKEVSKKYGISQNTLRYYEQAGMIPPVSRTGGGIRNYQECDLRWVELSLCMRKAGLPVEAISEYVRLAQQGDSTIPVRHDLLLRQREILLTQRRQIDETIDRLDYKIRCYEDALRTGTLIWKKEK